MAGFRVSVHPQFMCDYGPASRFVPPQVEVQQAADPGGGKPTEPNALAFIDPDGEMHVFLVPDETRKQLLSMLTGGIVVAGSGDLLGGDAPGGGM